MPIKSQLFDASCGRGYDSGREAAHALQAQVSGQGRRASQQGHTRPLCGLAVGHRYALDVRAIGAGGLVEGFPSWCAKMRAAW
mmetsp:Transcript_45615/g.111025  ORF Transcript_45615/g.111025 Transcript_45615/m.111025 type:complete len:83 (-) Transcript_45615:1753-2001(-)